MKLNPQQAPLYGECVLTVQLDDEDVCPTDKEEEEEKAEFYLLFSGSTQRHVSSTLRVSQVTLQAVCPAHNVCEQVLVTLCVARHGGPVDKQSQETFCFVQDLALDMAHFLLDSTDPQEALLLEEQQIPLKECEKLDQNLALALKHLSLPPHRTAPVDAQTGTSLTETQAHKDRETRGDTGNDVSALLDSSTAEAQVQQLCSLLHLAARHGLLAVASHVLQQPGGREALSKTDARGETAAREAERRGHEQLLELFKRYETSPHAEVESQQQVYPESQVFRHHANLGTYTLTLPALHRKEKRAEPGSREHLQEEVEQLRRLIHGHRDTKGNSGVCGPSAATHTSLHACTNSQQGSRQDAGPAAVTIETCSTTTEEQASPLSLGERTEREEPAGVSQTSCSSGSLHQAQEVRAEVKGSPAAGSPAGRNRKNKKKAARSKKTSSEERKRTEQRKTETAERNTDGTTLSTGPVRESVIGVGADTKTVDAEETASLIKPGGKCDDSKAETIVEKQEAEKWEVDLLMCERAAETESVTEIEQRLTEGQTETPRGLSSDLGSAAQITVTMGQEQSQDPQESQSDPEGPSPSDTTKPSPQSVMKTSPRSPDAERKPRRVLWRDGGWIGSRMGSPPNGQDEDTNTVWYQAEDLDQSDVKSQSVWYDRDTEDQKEQEQLEQREGEKKEGDLSSPQLFTKSSHQPSADLTQPHAAGTPPAPSHGPAAQRREVHASQREEEVGPDCKEEGSTHSRKNSETADNEETEGKGRKKRRKKRGKKGGTEAKLSSSSSVESQSHTETPTEPETNLNPEDKTQTGRADTQLTHREETDQAAMTLPSQTQGRTRDSHGPECNLTHSDPAFTPPEISLTDHSRTDPPAGTPSQTSETKEESADCHRPETLKAGSSDAAAKPLEGLTTLHPAGEEVSDSTEPDFKDKDGQDAQTEREAEIKASSENKDWSVAGEESVERTGLLECTSPRSTEDSFVEEFPEEKTHRTQSVDSDNPGQPVDPEGRPAGFMECERPAEAGGLPCGGTADMSPLLTGEGRADTAPREYLEHCLASEMLRDQPQKEEGKNELWVGEEEEGKERSCESGIEQREEESTSDRDKEQKYNEELAATAVAVVTVAIASAVASIELSQQLANNQSESEVSASKEEPAQDASVPTESLKQPAGDLLSSDQTSQLPAQLMSSEQSQVLAAVTAEAGDQLREQPHIKPAANADISEKVKDEQTAAEPRNNQQNNIHTPTPVGAPSVTEDNQTQETPDRLLVCSRPLEEDSILLSDHRPVPEPGDKISAEEENQTEIKLQVESPPPSPVTDTGQHPEDTHMSCPESEDSRVLRDQPVCQTEAVVRVESDRPRSEHAQTGEVDDVSPVDAAAEQGGERCENVSSDVSDCQEKESDPQLGDQLTALSEGGSPSVLCPLSQTPLDPPCDSAPDAAAGQEEPTASVDLQQGEHQPSHSPADMKLLPLHGERKAEGGVSVEGEVTKEPAVDTVDGWKQRERTKMEREDEAGEEKTAVEDRNIQGADSCEQSRREQEQDSTLTLQIQRDRDVFCPVQPRPEPDTVTCTDVLPETDECVSLCLMHTDKDGLTVSPTLDDSVFKKPADPSPRLGPRERGVHVSWSSTDDARPSEGALSVGSSEPASPRSSRLSWKSETEDRGGGGGGGGGEEEEKHDQLTENPVSSAIMRATIRSLSPLRRHSWEPAGNNATAQSDVTPSSPLGSPSAETKRAKTPLHRRSMSWCPSNLHHPDQQQIDSRSYSLEGLEEAGTLQTPCPSILSDQQERSAGRREERGSLLSLTEEEQEGDAGSIHSQPSHQVLSVTNSCPSMFHHQSLTKSISMVAISQRDIGGGSPFSSNSGSLEYSISEEEPGPLRSDTEGKGGPKISRTFSYLRNKMTKKGKEKEKEKRGERERESKEKEKKTLNGHLFVSISPSSSWVCLLCSRPLKDIKDTFICNNCGVYVHKCCRESLPVCSKSRTKMQSLVPDAAPGSAVSMRSKSTSSASSVSSTSSSSSRERWSTATTPDDQLPVLFPRRHPSIFNAHSNLSKSISTSNIAGLDDVPLKGLKFLSQSTDSLHQGSKVNASTESLTDEGTEMMDSQLMGEFECDVKDLEADSWSGTVDKKFLKALKKDEIKRQDVIYELYQTEFHHVRTLRIMSEVYYKGLQKELQLDPLTLDKIFPMLDELLDIHTLLFSQLLERKRASSSEGQNNNNFLIRSVGGVLLQQFSGCSADRMKKVYGKFCSRHNEAVNLYKDLHAKDKRFQAFIKRMMSSSIVRRLSIPECILLVTQRITKYPVLIQRILQHTKESDEDHSCVCEALRCVKELIAAVDSKVNEQEKKQKLREVYSRTDSKSIMRMKGGQMFAKEDLIRGRRLLHDGGLQLKNSAGRLKEVQAMLLSDVLVFLQEKDTKYVFASLDQRSTVISLQNLIVREVANEERGLFLITAGIERPEMVEVLASSKEERNTWRAIIQDAMHCMEKDEDEGVPSETEEDRRQQESRAKEIRELLRQKDEQIVSLLVEKVHIFRDLSDCSPAPDDRTPPVRERMLFRATADDVTKGEPIVKDALREVESLHALVHSGVGGAGCSTPVGLTGGSVGPVCLPRRAETFGGFDSHQMNSSKNGEKEEGDESLDLRRTESDSVLKKGATASLQMLLKRNNEQVQHTVTYLHDLLLSLQAVVVQQDSFIEDQRQALSDRLTANSSRHSSSSSLSSSSSSRPSSLIEQEKHRSLERQRQEAASLQKQQAAHQEEKRRREKAWDLKERGLAEREERLRVDEGETSRRRQELGEERETLQRKKEEYQRELERLREAQRRLDREKDALRRDTERLEAMRREESAQLKKYQRTPSTTSEESIRFHSSGSLEMDSKEAEESKEVELSSSAPTKEPFLRIGSKRMGKNFNPFSSSSSSSSKAQGAEKESQLPSRLLQLTKPKDKKDKKKKKGKDTENKVTSEPQNDGDIFFC